MPILCVDEAYSLLQRLTYQGKSTSQMSLSTERLCRCYDGDFWYVLKGTKGKRVGVTSDSTPCFYHSSAVPRVSLAKNCGFKKWVGRENAFLLSKKIRRSRRKLWLSWRVCCKSHSFKKMRILMLCFFLLRTDYFQSQFYTGMQKAGDTASNQEAGLLWSVGKRKKTNRLSRWHGSARRFWSSDIYSQERDKVSVQSKGVWEAIPASH